MWQKPKYLRDRKLNLVTGLDIGIQGEQLHPRPRMRLRVGWGMVLGRTKSNLTLGQGCQVGLGRTEGNVALDQGCQGAGKNQGQLHARAGMPRGLGQGARQSQGAQRLETQ